MEPDVHSLTVITNWDNPLKQWCQWEWAAHICQAMTCHNLTWKECTEVELQWWEDGIQLDLQWCNQADSHHQWTLWDQEHTEEHSSIHTWYKAQEEWVEILVLDSQEHQWECHNNKYHQLWTSNNLLPQSGYKSPNKRRKMERLLQKIISWTVIH